MSDAETRGRRSKQVSPLARKLVGYGFSLKGAAHYLVSSCGISRTRAYGALNGTIELSSDELILIATIFEASDLHGIEEEARLERDLETLHKAVDVALFRGEPSLAKRIEALRKRLGPRTFSVNEPPRNRQDP